MEDIELVFKVLGIVLSISVPFLMYKIKTQNEELVSIREKLSDKKYESYTDIFDLFFDMFRENMTLKEDEKERVDQLLGIQKRFLIYASDEVLNKYIEWKNATGKHPTGHMIPLLEIFPLIRKDMGNKDTKLTAKDILKVLMVGSEDVDTFYNNLKNDYAESIKQG